MGGGGGGEGDTPLFYMKGVVLPNSVISWLSKKKGITTPSSNVLNWECQHTRKLEWCVDIYGEQPQCCLSILNIVLSVICGSIGWICHPIKDIVWVKLGSELDLTMGQSVN